MERQQKTGNSAKHVLHQIDRTVVLESDSDTLLVS